MRYTIYALLSIFLAVSVAAAATSPHVHYFYKSAGRKERCPNSEKLGPVYCCACGDCQTKCN